MNIVAETDLKKKAPPPSVVIAGSSADADLLALSLAEQNVNVELLNSESTETAVTRCVDLHPTTVALLRHHGLFNNPSSRFSSYQTTLFRNLNQSIDEHRTFESPQDRSDVPAGLICSEEELRREIRDRLDSFENVSILPHDSVQGFRETENGIDVLSFDGTNEHRRSRSFLFGVDGPTSIVRQSAGVLSKPIGPASADIWLLTDTNIETIFFGLGDVSYIGVEDMDFQILRRPSGWQITFSFRTTDAWQDQAIDEAVRKNLRLLLGKDTPFEIKHQEIVRSAPYFAETTHPSTRVFLLGSAAYSLLSLGPMDINLALQDAFSLGSKIAQDLVSENLILDALETHETNRRVFRKEEYFNVSNALRAWDIRESVLKASANECKNAYAPMRANG